MESIVETLTAITKNPFIDLQTRTRAGWLLWCLNGRQSLGVLW